jgi:DNA-binding CsgD family transcriptional regulator
LGLCKELGTKWGVALLFNLLGEIALSKGTLATASQLAEEAMALNRELGRKASIASSLSLAARVETRQGNDTAARSLAEESLTLAREVDDEARLPFYLEVLAEVVAAQGAEAWAARLWGAAEALHEGLSSPLPPVYRAGYERAVSAARTHVGEKIFAAAWAQGRSMTLEQVLGSQGQEVLPQAVPSTRQPTTTKTHPTYPAGLTAREVEVLRLVATGLTDAQIAEQLVISPRTVTTHLTSIYNKLGISSRSAATRFAVEHQLT